jgi:hypothetical protein
LSGIQHLTVLGQSVKPEACTAPPPQLKKETAAIGSHVKNCEIRLKKTWMSPAVICLDEKIQCD